MTEARLKGLSSTAVGKISKLRSALSPDETERGAFIVLVGPDGVGKTEVARVMMASHTGPTAYFHFYPPILSGLASAPPPAGAPNPGKGASKGSRLLGVLRLSRNIVRFWLGYLLTVRPALRRGCLVVADRWAYGYIVQPHALRFYGPRWLAVFATQALPKPTLVVNLAAPAAVIRDRKQELTVEAIDRELATWARLPVARLRSFDTTATPQQVASGILGVLWL